MEEFENAFVGIMKLVGELLMSVLSVIPTVLKFVFWVLLAIFVLPCVWVAGTIYPLWVEWGEDF